jgi:hypothetical protein
MTTILINDPEQCARINSILAKYTPIAVSDQDGYRVLSIADRLQLMSIKLDEARN